MVYTKIMYSYAFSVVFVLQLAISLYQCEILPVFIWGDKSDAGDFPSVSAFQNVKSSEFQKEYLNKFIQNKAVIVAFVQDTLSSEDLSVNGDAYKNVHNPSIILPNVENPVSSLKNLKNIAKVSEIDLSDSMEELPNNFENQVIIVNLPTTVGASDRFEALKKNDALIGKFLKSFNKDNLVVIYTGIKPTWHSQSEIESLRRFARAATEPVKPQPNGTFINYKNFYAYATQVYFSIASIYNPNLNDKAIFEWPPLNQPSVVNPEDGCIKMNWPFSPSGNFSDVVMEITFNTSKSKFWMGHNATLSFTQTGQEARNLTLKTPYEIGASNGFSFSCGNASFMYKYKNDSEKEDLIVHFKIEKFQLEYFPKHNNSQFSSSFDCYTFFTVPLWMGLATILLFTSILAMGIFMLFEVKTMDRFDDPKGKTISVPLTD